MSGQVLHQTTIKKIDAVQNDGDLSPITPSDRDIVYGSKEWWEKWQVSTERDISLIDLKLVELRKKEFGAVRAVFS